MKIITRSILLSLLTAIAEGVVPFTFVFLLKQLFDFTELLVADGASSSSVLTMLFAILPSIMMMSMPIAVLLAAMMVYGRMASEKELVALYSVGYSVKQLLVPALMVGVLTTLIMLWWGERIAPKGNRVFSSTAIDVVQKTATAGIKPGTFTSLGGMVFSPTSVESGYMYGLKLFERHDDGIAGTITAPTASLTFHPDLNILMMHMEDGVLHQIPSPERDVVIQFKTFDVSIVIQNIVRRFTSSGRKVRGYSDKELDYYISEYQQAVEKAPNEEIQNYYFRNLKRCEVEKESRIAQPFACIIMVFLGAILGIRSRSAKRSACYSITVAAVFLYYLLLSFGSRYVEEGVISAWLGVWFPNLAGLAVTAYFYWTMADR